MKTYSKYGTCIRYQGSAYPVRISGGENRWASLAALRAMKPAGHGRIVFASMAEHPSHDRWWEIVSDGESVGIRSELWDGFRGDWPTVELFPSTEAALQGLKEICDRYTADDRWTQRV